MDNTTTNTFQIDNLPNRLTLVRVVLVPVIVLCLYFQLIPYAWASAYYNTLGWLAAIIFVAASITDFIDGHLARKRNLVTVFGSFMDPIADKFLTVSSLIMLQALNRIHVLIVIILILREFYMTSLRLLASTEGLTVPVSSYGKWKTATQMVGIPMLMITEPFYDIPLPIIGKVLVYISFFLSMHSSVLYSIGFMKKFKQLMAQKKALKKQGRTGTGSTNPTSTTDLSSQVPPQV